MIFPSGSASAAHPILSSSVFGGVMENYGLTPGYFLGLRFLGETTTLVYYGIFAATFLFVGGLLPFIYATLSALIITVLLQRFVLNRRQPYPQSSAVIITGCSSGIGLTSAVEFAEKGVVVYATVRKQSDADKLLAAVPKSAKGSIVPILMDIHSKDDIKAAYEAISADVKKKHLGVLGVINNAGHGYSTMLEQQDDAGTHGVFDTNVFGLVTFTNTFLPLVRSQRHIIQQESNGKLQPTIIIVSSVAGSLVMPNFSIYSATKFACESIGDAYRMELSKQGIDVVLVRPGQIATSFFDRVDMSPRSTIPADVRAEVETKYSSPIDRYYAYAALNINAMLQKLLTTRGSSPSLVAEVFEEALLTPTPLARYLVGDDAQLGSTGYYHLGDQAADIPFNDTFDTLESFAK